MAKILVVDDERVLVKGIKFNLENEGYQVITGYDGEEAVELVIAAKNDDKTGVINEAADLLYHVMVLLSAKDVKISEVCAELCKRNR